MTGDDRLLERSWLFLALRLAGRGAGSGNVEETAEQLAAGLDWAAHLGPEDRLRCLGELRDLILRAASAPDPTISEQHALAAEAEAWSARWRRSGEPAVMPSRLPGSDWRLRIDRTALRHQPIVDGSEHHLASVFSRLVVDHWFDLERTEEDRWRIRVGDLVVLVAVDHDGRAARVLVDTPVPEPLPPPPRPSDGDGSKGPAFRIRHVRLDGAGAAHLQALDPAPDLVARLPTAGLWEAGGAWSVLCGDGEGARLEEVIDPRGVCRACARELARIEALVEDARWALARDLAAPDIDHAIRARLPEVPF